MLYRVTDDGLVTPVEPTTALDEGTYEEQVEGWVAHDPGMLGERLLIIGRQVALDGGKDRIDLLALDEEGSLVIVGLELSVVDVPFPKIR